MNKQNIERAGFFLNGLLSRVKENKEFFEGISVIFYSGTKQFSLEAKMKGDKLSYIFGGVSYDIDISAFKVFILEQLPSYERMTFSYNERGKSIIIEADGKSVVTNTVSGRSASSDKTLKKRSASASVSGREYYINQNSASDLLKVIGIVGQNGKIKNDMIRKYNQIDHFVELILPLVVSICESKDTVYIIDCACGKSYLSFVLNYYIKEVMGKRCFFTGLDYNGDVIKDSRQMAAELNYNNMEFIETDIMSYKPDKKYDLLLTLHACDTATDKALNFAMKNNIKSIVCVPCCHREMNSQYRLNGFEGIIKYGVLRARIADSLTDGMRAMYLEAQGYEVSAVEYISPLDTPKNLMLKAIKNKSVDAAKLNEFNSLCDLLGVSLSIGRFS